MDTKISTGIESSPTQVAIANTLSFNVREQVVIWNRTLRVTADKNLRVTTPVVNGEPITGNAKMIYKIGL